MSHMIANNIRWLNVNIPCLNAFLKKAWIRHQLQYIVFSCCESSQILPPTQTGNGYVTHPLAFSSSSMFNYTKANVWKIYYHPHRLLFYGRRKHNKEKRKTPEELALSFLHYILCSWELMRKTLWNAGWGLPCHSGWSCLKRKTWHAVYISPFLLFYFPFSHSYN